VNTIADAEVVRAAAVEVARVAPDVIDRVGQEAGQRGPARRGRPQRAVSFTAGSGIGSEPQTDS
jgi:hypothetical protein